MTLDQFCNKSIAYKYSPDNSNIFIMKGYSADGLSILIMNSISKVTRGVRGIPSEFENEIFEPFFRINKIYDERFFLEELGFGIGLSVIQKGITSLDGNVFVYEVNDHVTSLEPEKKIVSELILRHAE
ncbi:MAG: sensor histidine kinase [Leptospiraceae bacterium]|nr:sensor histidine kinase [Leptospiraceae bacterium]